MRDLAKFLLEHDNFYVFAHVSPDGDCIGSALAVTEALQSLGKRAFACIPGGVPGYLSFMPGAEAPHSPADAPFEMQTAFAVDVSAPDRMGTNGEFFSACEATAVLDHHKSNPLFGKVNFVDPARASTGELVLDLIRELGVTLTASMADNLFTAISSDSGNFNFGSCTPATFRAAADCVEAGANFEEITRRLYRTRTYPRTKLLGAALETMELFENGKVAMAHVTQAMFDKYGAVKADTERIVNYLIETEGVMIAALAVEISAEKVKFSLRSKPPYNVGLDVARPFGGGGHEAAAGVTLEKNMEAAKLDVLNKIREVL